MKHLFTSFVLTFLVGDGARSFASALAGSLAFAATAFASRFLKSLFDKGFDLFHFYISP